MYDVPLTTNVVPVSVADNMPVPGVNDPFVTVPVSIPPVNVPVSSRYVPTSSVHVPVPAVYTPVSSVHVRSVTVPVSVPAVSAPAVTFALPSPPVLPNVPVATFAPRQPSFLPDVRFRAALLPQTHATSSPAPWGFGARQFWPHAGAAGSGVVSSAAAASSQPFVRRSVVQPPVSSVAPPAPRAQLGSELAQPVSAHAPWSVPYPEHNVISSFSIRHRLPPIPSATLTLIREGKFVDFNTLFSAMYAGEAPTRELSIYLPEPGSEVEDVGQQTVRIRQSPVSKHKITCYADWSRTWNDYFIAVSTLHPHLAPSMAGYQAIIARFAATYDFHAWCRYDVAFRRLIAVDASVQWNQIDEDIYNRHLRGAGQSTSTVNSPRVDAAFPGRRPRPGCYRCGVVGHLARFCGLHSRQAGSQMQAPTPSPASFPPVQPVRPHGRPFRFPSPAPAPRAPVRPLLPTSTQPFRAPQRYRNGYCFDYQRNRQCIHSPCIWLHRCSLCDGNHPADWCNSS